jgi:hypothetical protein
MSNFTLAPEEDDPNAFGGRTYQPTETQKTRYRAQLHESGLGPLSLPLRRKEEVDTVAIAMKYLIDGVNRNARRNAK